MRAEKIIAKMAGWKSFTIFPLFFCLTFLVVGILTIWYSCSIHPNWKTSSFRNLHFCSTMNPFCVLHPGWSGSQCFPASPLLHTAYQPFQKGQLLSHVAVVSFKKYCWMVLKTYLGDFRYCIYGYLLFLGDWWSGSQLRVFAKEDLARQVAVAICFWYWTYDMTRFIYQHKFQLETESKGAEHGLILMNHHTELDWIYSWMVGIKSSDFELNSELGSCCKFYQ